MVVRCSRNSPTDCDLRLHQSSDKPLVSPSLVSSSVLVALPACLPCQACWAGLNWPLPRTVAQSVRKAIEHQFDSLLTSPGRPTIDPVFRGSVKCP